MDWNGFILKIDDMLICNWLPRTLFKLNLLEKSLVLFFTSLLSTLPLSISIGAEFGY